MLIDDVCSGHVRCIGLLGPFMSAGFKATVASDFFFRAVRRPVVSDSLGRLLCSLIDALSVQSNYARPDRRLVTLQAALSGG